MGAKAFRQHRNHRPFTLWMAGGGVKAGARVGATDELSYRAVEDQVTNFDFQDTILHLLGMDHKRLPYRFQGRDFRLTDVQGETVKNLIV